MMLQVSEYVAMDILVFLSLPFLCAAYVNWIKHKCAGANPGGTNVIDVSAFPYKGYLWFCVSYGIVMAIVTSFPIYQENPHNFYCDPALVDGATQVFALHNTWNGKACQITVQTYLEAAFAFCAFFLLLYLPLLAGTTFALIARVFGKSKFVEQLLRQRR